MDLKQRNKPCDECPWRTDQAPGRFSADRYRKLAATAYDMAISQFACHKSAEGGEVPCAGFLLRGATHNLGARMAAVWGQTDLRLVSDGGYDLYPSYREMAIANGVGEDENCLINVRAD